MDYEAEVREWLDLKVVTGRYSVGFVRELAAHLQNRTVNVFSIYDEIGFLEGAQYSRPTQTKPASAFRRKPLLGLWHKHYTQACFLPKNLVNHWSEKRLETLFSAVLVDATIPPERHLDYVAYAMVMEGYQERSAAHELTGEWIVYAKHDGRNYYLTLGTHGEDDLILNRVRACHSEFPQLGPV